MTHGYRNIFGGGEDWTDLLTSGIAYIEAVAQDWIFGTTLPVGPSGAWWRKQQEMARLKRRRIDEDEFILIGG